MLSRRSFLKVAGLGVLALGTGYGIGSIYKRKDDFISMYGFLPADENLITEVFTIFGNHINNGKINSVSVSGDSYVMQSIKSATDKFTAYSFSGGNSININVTEINDNRYGDVLLRNNYFVLSPEDNYDKILTNLRLNLKNKKAKYYFSADINQNDFTGGLIKRSQTLIIENEKGVFDEIKLDRKSSDIIIPGNCGNTIISAGNNTAYVKKSSCRNKLCEHFGHISSSVPVIACAPNKVILRTV